MATFMACMLIISLVVLLLTAVCATIGHIQYNTQGFRSYADQAHRTSRDKTYVLTAQVFGSTLIISVLSLMTML